MCPCVLALHCPGCIGLSTLLWLTLIFVECLCTAFVYPHGLHTPSVVCVQWQCACSLLFHFSFSFSIRALNRECVCMCVCIIHIVNLFESFPADWVFLRLYALLLLLFSLQFVHSSPPPLFRAWSVQKTYIRFAPFVLLILDLPLDVLVFILVFKLFFLLFHFLVLFLSFPIHSRLFTIRSCLVVSYNIYAFTIFAVFFSFSLRFFVVNCSR